MKRTQLLQEGTFPSNMTIYEFLNKSRFELNEFLNNITLETFSKVDNKYEHLFWTDNDPTKNPKFPMTAFAKAI